MALVKQMLSALRNERAAAQATVPKLERAIAALAELGGKGAGGRRPGLPGRAARHMSLAARRRIAAAQRARWARVRAAKAGKLAKAAAG
jgi:hypothetical protein